MNCTHEIPEGLTIKVVTRPRIDCPFCREEALRDQIATLERKVAEACCLLQFARTKIEPKLAGPIADWHRDVMLWNGGSVLVQGDSGEPKP